MAPAWFIPAMESLMPRLIISLGIMMAPTLTAVARLTNQFRDDGATIPFCAIPFFDGSNPMTVNNHFLIFIFIYAH